ncbi:hypothetical protein HS088_TW16G00395 [Tripterygium wilfordii]|uniref:Uncharacterized protein n=1 Tax=Tripterygium wilfordii TaxID=458696 RepID=A0A7J7CIU1_TRIWF|nr:uncharacterized protein LOC119980602 [Tripterygium wilfordii]KAF5733954.1 hypothetical protein HS088_TW16G00395 [Tripterygium wilfordii]
MSQSSAKSHNKCSLAPVPAKVKRRKKNQSTFTPLQDLNNAIATHNSSKDSNGSSSLSSIEAPRGCLRFFLSHSSSSNRIHFDNNKPSKSKPSRNPKSAPNVRKVRPKESSLKRTVFEKPVSNKLSGRKPSYKICKGSKNCSVSDPSGSSVNKGHAGSEELRLVSGEKCYNGDAILTPSCKVATGSKLILDNCEKSNSKTSGSSNKTPPVQASVSPELQCGSSMVSTDTPACYGAGHVLSGIRDKRKCRPRGILTIGNNDLGFGKAEAFDSDDDDDDKENAVLHNSGVSPIPSPAEASMHWLLSPCNEEDENQSLHSPLSPSSSNIVFSSGVKSNNKSTAAVIFKRGTSFTSPGGIPDVQGKLGSPVHDSLAVASLSCAIFACDAEDASAEKCRRHQYDIDGENSPFSPFSMDSLGSGNVIQTPESDSNSSRCGGLSWLRSDAHEKCFFDSELNLLAENLKMATLSPKSHVSSWDPIGSSFQFDCMTVPSDSVDISHFQKILNDRTSQISKSTLESLSQSPMRISWREGLASRIFEMDEFDCCRCFSDEEEHENSNNNELMKSPQSADLKFDAGEHKIVADGFGSMEFMDNVLGLDKEGKEDPPPEIPCSCAESISTDGGGLVCSNDSDWTLCYKNQLFKD